MSRPTLAAEFDDMRLRREAVEALAQLLLRGTRSSAGSRCVNAAAALTSAGAPLFVAVVRTPARDYTR